MCFQLIPLAVIAVVEGVEAGTAAAIGGEALADVLLTGLEAAGAGFSEGLIGEVADAGLDCLLGPVGGTVAGFALGVSSGASAVAGVSGSIATGSLPGLDELGSSAGAPSGLTFVSSAPLDSGANVPDDAQTLSSLQGADFDQAAVEQFHSLLNGLGGSDNSGMQLASFNPSGGNGVVQIGNAQVGSNDLPAGYTVDDGSVASSLDSTGFQNVADKSGAAPAQPSQVPDLVGQIHDLPEGSHVSQFGDYSYVVTYPPEWEDGNQVVPVLVIGHVDSQAAQYAASLGLPATGGTVVLPQPSSIPAPDFTAPPVKATPGPTDYVGLSQSPSGATTPSPSTTSTTPSATSVDPFAQFIRDRLNPGSPSPGSPTGQPTNPLQKAINEALQKAPFSERPPTAWPPAGGVFPFTPLPPDPADQPPRFFDPPPPNPFWNPPIGPPLPPPPPPPKGQGDASPTSDENRIEHGFFDSVNRTILGQDRAKARDWAIGWAHEHPDDPMAQGILREQFAKGLGLQILLTLIADVGPGPWFDQLASSGPTLPGALPSAGSETTIQGPAGDPQINFSEMSPQGSNYVRGNAAADELADLLRENGMIVEREVSTDTIVGLRRSDLRVTNPSTGTVERIEVKVGGSPYIASQRAKDFLIHLFEGEPTHLVRLKSYP